MPNEDFLPGVAGQDYTFVRRGGKVYVVYSVKVGGRTVKMSWSIPPDKLKHYGVKDGQIRTISGPQFRNIQFFGSADEITATGSDDSPFQSFLRDLRAEHRGASWLHDREVMEIFMMGHLEGLDSQAILNRVKSTKWYESRTDRTRQWELEMSKEQQKVELSSFRTRMLEEIENLLGAGFSLKDLGISPKDFEAMVLKVASGKLGNPEEGFLVWSNGIRQQAEKLEGSLAWIDKDAQASEQNQYMNRPEEMAEKIRQEALEWLGPKGVPDKETLNNWASRLVSGKSSSADWEQFLQAQAKNLHPWLGANERWQDRASSYKQMTEQILGKGVGFDHALFDQIGGTDDAGAPTGAALDFTSFAKKVRQTDEYWQSQNAESDAFNLMGKLNSMFNGVS